MKKAVALALAVIMVLSFAAVAFAEEEEPAPPVIKIGVAVPDAETGWAAGAAYYAEKYCQDNDLEYQIEKAASAADMKSALRSLTSWGATAIVMYPQWTELEEAVQGVLDAGIRVVNLGMDVACEGIYKVAGNNQGVGSSSARYIVDAVGNGAIVAVMDVPSAGSVSEQRKQGFYDYLTQLGYDTTNVFEVQAGGFSREEGTDAMAFALDDYDRIDAVFAMDDELAMGAIDAITQAGRGDVKVLTGGGGCQEFLGMIDGEEYAAIDLATALYSPIMIENAIQVAVNVLNGTGAEASTVVPTALISAENAEEYLDPENTAY